MNTQIRNIFHVLSGFTLLYWFNNFSNIFSTDAIDVYICGTIISVIISTVVGMFWELIQSNLNNEIKGDFYDALRTGFGGLLSALSLILFGYNETVFKISCIIFVTVLVFEIKKYIKKK